MKTYLELLFSIERITISILACVIAQLVIFLIFFILYSLKP